MRGVVHYPYGSLGLKSLGAVETPGLFKCPDGRMLLSQADCADKSLPSLHMCPDGMPVTDPSLCKKSWKEYIVPAALVLGLILILKK
jgi:hypothetical protein